MQHSANFLFYLLRFSAWNGVRGSI